MEAGWNEEKKDAVSRPLSLHGKTVPNRLVIQPMEGCDGTKDGRIGELTRRRYLRFAESGAGIIWFEATAVCQEGRANPRQLWLQNENVEEYGALLAQIRAESMRRFGYAPLIILQATHSGRYSKPKGEPQPMVAYRREIFEKGKEGFPYHIITDEECAALPSFYEKTALLAAKAGFDAVDVKCCHGYLLNEFLSAWDRPGDFGGDFASRTRLYLSCIDAVKAVLPSHMFVTTRLSGYDGFPYPWGFGADPEGGIDLAETEKLLILLQNRGIQLINLTIGNPYLIPHVNRPWKGGPEDGAVGVARAAQITGKLQNAFPELKFVMSALTYPGTSALAFANQCLEDGRCQLTGFGRMAFAYPDFYTDYQTYGALNPDKVCIKCGSCSKMMRSGTVAGCPVRDREVYLPLFQALSNK